MTDAHLLDWLYARQRFGIMPGLARVRALLERLGEPQTAFKVVLVGGTNGKGSAAATLASILTASGRRTALFTSPHLSHFNERFLVDGEPLADGAVAAALGELKGPAQEVGATFFEIVTALACLLFARNGVEIAVMEVGLGGRFDATNALEPELSLITSVALDHTEILGDTLAAVAFEKAGIMRPGKLLLTAAEAEALEVLRAQAETLGATLWSLGEAIAVEVEALGWQGLRCRITSPLGTVTVHTPLLGRHQAGNVSLAAVAAAWLGASHEAIDAGVRRTRWPGRLERLAYGGRQFLLDGAHNPAAAKALADALHALGAKPSCLIFGAGEDKDVAGMIGALAPLAETVVVTRATLSPRAAAPEALAALWPGPAQLAPTPTEAVRQALALSASSKGDSNSNSDVIVVAGSLYLVGEVRPYLLGAAAEHRERWQ